MNKTYELLVESAPFSKERPRFSSFGRFIKVYTPAKTLAKEKEIKELFLQTFPIHDIIKVAFRIEIIAYMPIPKSTSKVKRQKMITNEIKHVSKPDIDNISKLVLDALNGVAYKDDSQLIELIAEKRYSETPSVKIIITELE